MKKAIFPKNKQILDTLTASYAKTPDQERLDALIAAQNDPIKMAEIAGAREFSVYLNIMSQSIALENWEYVPLKRGEWPQFVNTYNKKLAVRVFSPDGGSFNEYLSDPATTASYSPYRLSTDWIYVPSMNTISNKLPYSDRVNDMIAEAMTVKIDTLARTAEDSGFGTLTAGTEYVLNDSRKTNMPDTTEVSATSEGAITIGLIKKILQHFINVGRRVRKIEYNPSHASELWDWSSVVSGQSATAVVSSTDTVPQYLQEEMYRNGTINNIFGYNIELVPVDTIDTKYVRVYSDQPVGYFFDVPELASVGYFDENQVSMLKGVENQEAYRETRSILFVQPAHYKLNYARFQFDS